MWPASVTFSRIRTPSWGHELLNALSMPPVLLPLSERGSPPAIFIVHGKLGIADLSAEFVEWFGQDHPVFALQARGLDGLEAPNPTVEAMAADYVHAIQRIQPCGPYSVGALCAGGYVVIEMARLLRKQGCDVLPLLLIDPPPPRRLLRQQYRSRPSTESSIVAQFGRLAARGCVKTNLQGETRRRAAVAVVAAFTRALSEYSPTPYDREVYLLASNRRLRRGWGGRDNLAKLFTGTLNLSSIAENHVDIFDAGNDALAAGLRVWLRRVRD
jgi:thioesterase domain-containing protein